MMARQNRARAEAADFYAQLLARYCFGQAVNPQRQKSVAATQRKVVFEVDRIRHIAKRSEGCWLKR
jgi:hypothetical protein